MEAYIVIFLLLFAILAFGWFYLQRAKARDAAAGADVVAAAPATTTEPSVTPVEAAEPVEPEVPRTDPTAS